MDNVSRVMNIRRRSNKITEGFVEYFIELVTRLGNERGITVEANYMMNHITYTLAGDDNKEFCTSKALLMGGSLELPYIYIPAEHQKQGFTTQMLKELIGVCDRFNIKCIKVDIVLNEYLLNTLEKLNFKRVYFNYPICGTSETEDDLKLVDMVYFAE